MPGPGVGCSAIIGEYAIRTPKGQVLTHPGRHRLFHKAKRQDKHQEIHRYVFRGSSMKPAGSLALGKGVKTALGLSPSKWYANVTGKSYFSPNQKIGMGICKICSQDTDYVKFHMY